MVVLPVLGIDTPFHVVDGYEDVALLGEPFVSYPGFSVSADLLSVAGVGSIPLREYHAPLGVVVGQPGVVRRLPMAAFATPPLVQSIIQPQDWHPRSFGLHSHSLAADSPVTWEQLVLDCQDPLKFALWRDAFIRAKEQWREREVYRGLENVPAGATRLRLKFVLTYKPDETNSSVVFRVRPVVTETKGSSPLDAKDLYTPGLNHVSHRLLTVIYLGKRNAGKDYGMWCGDFQRAFLHSDAGVAQQTWQGTRYVVKVPVVWQDGTIGSEYIELLTGVEGLQSSPIIFRISAEEVLQNLGATYHRADPNFFVVPTGVPGEPALFVWHGDDFKLVAPRTFATQFLAAVAAKFPLGRAVDHEEGKPVVFCGVQSTLQRDSRSGEWVMHMQDSRNYVVDLLADLPSPLLATHGPSVKGKLGWLADTVAPDLAVLARLPDDVLEGLGSIHVRRQLAMTPGIVLRGLDCSQPVHLEIVTDANLETRTVSQVRARMGALFFISNEGQPGMLLDWYSRLHSRIATSPNTAECRGIVSAISHGMWLRYLLGWVFGSCGFTLHWTSTVHTDSQSCLAFLDNPYARSQDVDYLVLAEAASCVTRLQHIADELNPADALTKEAREAAPQYAVLRKRMTMQHP
eukprot:jgi/Mesvir1/3679/Mv25520-RA.1